MLGPMGLDENGKPVKIQRTQLRNLQPAGGGLNNVNKFTGGLADAIMGAAMQKLDTIDVDALEKDFARTQANM